MGLLEKIFGKRKEEIVVEETTEQSPTELQMVCGGDREVYQALSHVMFLDPTKIRMTMEEAVKKANEFEKEGDKLKAKIHYEIAGGLAIYKGDVAKVKQYFGKAQKLSKKEKYYILKVPEKAVAKAQEYYRQYLKK
jgi:hypothetical protein